LGLEHEPVADDADILPVLQQLTQPAEEVRTIALQLLYLARKCRVEPLAQILDPILRLLILALGGLEGLVEGRDLAAQREELLIEQVDLGQRLVGDLGLLVETSGQRADAPLAAPQDRKSVVWERV